MKIIEYFRVYKSYLYIFCFYIFLFSLPLSRRKEFYLDYSYYDGMFFEYNTIIFYLFELAILLSLIFLLASKNVFKDNLYNFIHKEKKIIFYFLALFFISLLSLFQSRMIELSYYYIITYFFIFIFFLLSLSVLKDKKYLFIAIRIFIITIAIQGVIGWLQFINGGSIGLHFLGEQYLNSDQLGVAKIVFNGDKHIRPYGTFTHPNILAYFLSTGALLALYLYDKYKNNLDRLVFALLSISLLITFSRVAILVFLLSLIFILVKRFRISFRDMFKMSHLGYAVIFLSALLVLLYRLNPLSYLNWESLLVRRDLGQAALDILVSNPMGVGIGNYSVEMIERFGSWPSWMIQPVHNTYFIILVELGLISLPFITYFLFMLIRELKNRSIFISSLMVSLLIFMLFDHAFWDIRQTQYLFVFVLSLYVVLLEKDQII